LEYGRHVSMERFSHPIMQDSVAVLGAENEVNVESGERLRHGFRTPFQGCIVA